MRQSARYNTARDVRPQHYRLTMRGDTPHWSGERSLPKRTLRDEEDTARLADHERAAQCTPYAWMTKRDYLDRFPERAR